MPDMSEWIRPIGGQWHRYTALQDDTAIDRGGYTFSCGEFLLTREGWETAIPELEPEDDTHAPCLHRAKREAHWRDRFNAAPKQPMPWMVRDLALEIDPALQGVVITPQPVQRGERGIERIAFAAANVEVKIVAAGRTMAWAVAELLASVELDLRPA